MGKARLAVMTVFLLFACREDQEISRSHQEPTAKAIEVAAHPHTFTVLSAGESDYPCGCEIRVVFEADYGGKSPEESPDQFSGATMLSSGGLLIHQSYAGTPTAFRGDFSLSFPKGEGPGEFVSGQDAVAVGDTVFVLDGGARRISVMDQNLKVVRTQLANGALSLAVAGGHTYILRAVRTGGIDDAVARLDDAGRITQTFGQTLPEDEDWTVAPQMIAAGIDGPIVIAAATRYRLDLFNTDGSRLSVLQPDLSWFNSYTTFGPRQQNVRQAKPSIRDITVDTVGRVWVLISRPVEGYVPQKGPPAPGAPLPLSELDRRYDSVIHVFERNSRTPVAGIRIDEYIGGFAGHGRMWRHVELPDGNILMETWKAALEIFPAN